MDRPGALVKRNKFVIRTADALMVALFVDLLATVLNAAHAMTDISAINKEVAWRNNRRNKKLMLLVVKTILLINTTYILVYIYLSIIIFKILIL